MFYVVSPALSGFHNEAYNTIQLSGITQTRTLMYNIGQHILDIGGHDVPQDKGKAR